jgi:hypothetical protein
MKSQQQSADLKQIEEMILEGIKQAEESLVKERKTNEKLNAPKYNTALYLTLGAAVVGVVAFIVLRKKK